MKDMSGATMEELRVLEESGYTFVDEESGTRVNVKFLIGGRSHACVICKEFSNEAIYN